MLLAKQFENAQQVIIICSKSTNNIIKSIKLFNFFRLSFHDYFLLLDQVKKIFKWRRVEVIITYIAIQTFGHVAHVRWWWSFLVGVALDWLIKWACSPQPTHSKRKIEASCMAFSPSFPYSSYCAWFSQPVGEICMVKYSTLPRWTVKPFRRDSIHPQWANSQGGEAS